MRLLQPEQLLNWANDPKSVVRLRTANDVLPNKHTAAWLPTLVDWQQSQLEGPAPFFILRNINHGGNPLERTTVFHTIKVPIAGVEFAEFTLVPQVRSRPNTNFQHGHLRFVFKQDDRPILLSQADPQNGSDPYLDDLVFSWEPWRAIDAKFGFLSALDDRFDLSMRGYSGAQRYLDDALSGLPWISYRLRMPGGDHGRRELLSVCLAIGDGAARHLITQMLEDNEQAWLATRPNDIAMQDAAKDQWAQLRTRIGSSRGPASITQSLDGDQHSYNTLVRSCASLARYSVLLAAHRLANQGFDDGVVKENLPPPALGKSEPWMQQVASGDLFGMFANAPAAIKFLLRNPSARPKSIPNELDAAGLIVRRDGKPWTIRHDKDHVRPYGPVGVNRDSH